MNVNSDKEHKGCRRWIKSGCFLYVVLPLFIGALIVAGIALFEYSTRHSKQVRADKDIQFLREAIHQYQLDHHAYPAVLDNLLKPKQYVDALPADPFSPGKETYKYVNLQEGGIATVYSVGSDGEDNYTFKDYPGSFDTEGSPIDQSDLLDYLQIEWTRDDPDNAVPLLCKAGLGPNLTYNLSLHKTDALVYLGWERAEQFYNDVAGLKGSDPLPPQWEEMKGIIWFGYSAGLDDVSAIIRANQTRIDLVKAAAKKPHRLYIVKEGLCNSIISADANNLTKHVLAKIVICDAKKLEWEGKLDEALDNYLAIIAMGQIIGARNSSMIPYYNGLSLQRSGYLVLQTALLSIDYGPERLLHVIKKLEELKKEAPKVEESLWNQHEYTSSFLKNNSLIINSYGSASLPDVAKGWMTLNLNRKGVISNNRLYTERQIALSKLPYHELAKIEAGNNLAGMDIINATLLRMFGGKSLFVRITDITANAPGTKLLAALQYYKAIHGTYPDSLDDLNELFESPPVDPFTEKPFVYKREEAIFRLYSPGTDLVDDGGMIEYDPTNGSISKGDHIFSPRRGP